MFLFPNSAAHTAGVVVVFALVCGCQGASESPPAPRSANRSPSEVKKELREVSRAEELRLRDLPEKEQPHWLENCSRPLIVPDTSRLDNQALDIALAHRGDCLVLQKTPTVSVALAKKLAAWRGKPAVSRRFAGSDFTGTTLVVGGVRALDVAAVREIASLSVTHLVLDDLTTLDSWGLVELPVTDGLLGKAQRPVTSSLSMNGLVSLTAEDARVVTTWASGKLSLNGVRELGVPVLAALVEWSGSSLSLDGLEAPSVEVLASLCGKIGGTFSLGGLRTLDEPTAEALKRCSKDGLYLDGVRQLTPAAAARLVARPFSFGSLSLGGLEDLDVATARALSKWRGKRLSLDGLRAVSPEVVALLGKLAVWELSLDGIHRMAPEHASALAGWRGSTLSLGGLTQLDPQVAAALAKWHGTVLRLNGLRSLEGAAPSLHALQPKKGRTRLISLTLANVRTMDAESADALAALNVRRLFLDRLERLTPEVAAALAGSAGESLTLTSLRALEPAAARALTSWQGERIEINGIEAIDRETAEALARWGGVFLFMKGLESIDADVAVALAKWPGKFLVVDNLESIEGFTQEQQEAWFGALRAKRGIY